MSRNVFFFVTKISGRNVILFMGKSVANHPAQPSDSLVLIRLFEENPQEWGEQP